MENPHKMPKWGILYGGNKFVLFFLYPMHTPDGIRCAMVSSNIIAIQSTETPFFHLLLYMCLVEKSHKGLAETLLQEPLIRELEVASPSELFFDSEGEVASALFKTSDFDESGQCMLRIPFLKRESEGLLA
jgi:hypothetical protein